MMHKYGGKSVIGSFKHDTKNLYGKDQSAVLFNGRIGNWFRTTVGVRQGCLLSPTFFNSFLERIMCEAVDNHGSSVSIGAGLLLSSVSKMILFKMQKRKT